MTEHAQPLNRIDTLPWYRQFWPWFLIVLPASVVVAAFITLFIANRGADDLVVSEYYKDGLAINQRLELEQRAASLGLSADLQFSSTAVTVTLQHASPAQRLQLTLSHPMEANQDFELPLMQAATGVYTAALPHPVGERWHWSLQPLEGEPWRLTGVVGKRELASHRNP
ncbi:MAG: FixH family protein [Halioglobus sp.]